MLPLRGFSLFNPLKVHSPHSYLLFAAAAHRSWSSAAWGTFTMWNSMRSFLRSSIHISKGKKVIVFFRIRTLDAVGSSWKGQTTAWGQYLWEFFSFWFSSRRRLDWHLVPCVEPNVGLKSNIWQQRNWAFRHMCYFGGNFLFFQGTTSAHIQTTQHPLTYMHAFSAFMH